MQAIINGEMYEIEPAVKVIIDKLMIENAELKAENARLEELYQKSIGVIAATDCAECKDKVIKHAYWEEKQDMNGDTYYHCTNCKEDFVFVEGTPKDNLYYYCPNCGAKMDGGAADV